MRFWLLPLIAGASLHAADVRARVDGVGCRTRQLAVQRIWEDMSAVTEVIILPRDERPARNQRYFILRCPGDAPTLEQLNEALGRRAKYYRAIEIGPPPADEDAE